MSNLDFSALLDTEASKIVKPKPMPEGEYIFAIKDFKFGHANNANKTPKVDFEVVYQEPLPSVDATVLDEILDGEDIATKKSQATFFITGDAAWRLKQFLVDHVGVPEEGTLRDMISAAKSGRFVGTIKHVASQRDATDIFAQLNGTAAVPSV